MARSGHSAQRGGREPGMAFQRVREALLHFLEALAIEIEERLISPFCPSPTDSVFGNGIAAGLSKVLPGVNVRCAICAD